MTESGSNVILIIVVGIGVSLLVVMFLLSRMGRNRKQEAIADLEREREATKAPDIIELIREEISDLGIDDIDGGDGIDPSILLQVYRRDVVNCEDGATRRFVLAEGVDAADADLDSLTLNCD